MSPLFRTTCLISSKVCLVSSGCCCLFIHFSIQVSKLLFQPSLCHTGIKHGQIQGLNQEMEVMFEIAHITAVRLLLQIENSNHVKVYSMMPCIVFCFSVKHIGLLIQFQERYCIKMAEYILDIKQGFSNFCRPQTPFEV